MLGRVWDCEEGCNTEEFGTVKRDAIQSSLRTRVLGSCKSKSRIFLIWMATGTGPRIVETASKAATNRSAPSASSSPA
jgi:hypothetical protein